MNDRFQQYSMTTLMKERRCSVAIVALAFGCVAHVGRRRIFLFQERIILSLALSFAFAYLFSFSSSSSSSFSFHCLVFLLHLFSLLRLHSSTFSPLFDYPLFFLLTLWSFRLIKLDNGLRCLIAHDPSGLALIILSISECNLKIQILHLIRRQNLMSF
jgi:hypothetical protein